MDLKKWLMIIKNKIGIVRDYELVEYLEVEDPAVLAKAIRNRSEEHCRTADSWSYLCRLIEDKKLTDEFIKEHQHYFTFGYLLDKKLISFDDLRRYNYLKYHQLSDAQKSEAPLWYKLSRPTAFGSFDFTTSDKKTVFKLKISSQFGSSSYGAVLVKLIISNEDNYYVAPIESALDFKVINGKLYFGTATHDFDITWDGDEDKENLTLLSDLISNKIISNVKELKSNAKKFAEAPLEQHKELLAAMNANKQGVDPFLAGALGMGLGLIIGSE